MSATTIHDIGVALQAYLRANGCPLAVIDGPEDTTTTTWGRERIVLEHDVDAKGSLGDPRGLHINAKHRHTAADPYKLTIYAQSKVAGAKEFEHRTRAFNVRETVIAGLDLVAATNRNRWKHSSGGFVTPPDMAKAQTQGGAVYQLSFTYELPIRVVTFVGEARPEAVIAGLTSMTKVSRAGTPDDDDNPNTPPASAETACGGT